ncbi:MAG: MBL fold metallo-hydrolase [Bacteroidales bacterium]|nr:MBL fold metallo-hydrolase [Bacteroidales bacterium]
MRLTFLGTGTSQGVPVIACHCRVCRSGDSRDRRLRTSALLEVEGRNILFDIGPDFRQQMLREDVGRLDAILITHAHRDHVGGLDDIRSFNYVQHSKMDVYLNAEARFAIERDYHYIFEPHQYPGLPEADLHTVEAPFTAAGVEVVPVKAMHKDLPVLGYRIGAMAYITDANYMAPAEIAKLKGVKVLVINALRREKHFSHYSLPEALAVIEEVAPERAYLTHMSHEMGLHEEVSATLPPHVALAYDGLKVEI